MKKLLKAKSATNRDPLLELKSYVEMAYTANGHLVTEHEIERDAKALLPYYPFWNFHWELTFINGKLHKIQISYPK